MAEELKSGTAILIPEVEIYETLNNILDYVREEYAQAKDKKETFLWFVFGIREDGRPLQLGKLNFFNQAVDIFINGGVEKKRKVEVSVGYNSARMGLPTLHIVMPAESSKNAGIGDNRGYMENVDDSIKGISYDVVTADASVVYSIIITSDNVNESLILYNFLKAAFLGFKLQLELKGFQNVRSGGTDLSLSDDLVPVGIYHRSFNLNFDYDYSTIDVFGEKYAKTFSFDFKPVEKTT